MGRHDHRFSLSRKNWKKRGNYHCCNQWYAMRLKVCRVSFRIPNRLYDWAHSSESCRQVGSTVQILGKYAKRLMDGEGNLKMNVFNASLDIIISELLHRFTFVWNQQPVSFYPTWNTDQCTGGCPSSECKELYWALVEIYWVAAIRACFESKVVKQSTVKDLARVLIMEHSSTASLSHQWLQLLLEL